VRLNCPSAPLGCNYPTVDDKVVQDQTHGQNKDEIASHTTICARSAYDTSPPRAIITLLSHAQVQQQQVNLPVCYSLQREYLYMVKNVPFTSACRSLHRACTSVSPDASASTRRPAHRPPLLCNRRGRLSNQPLLKLTMTSVRAERRRYMEPRTIRPSRAERRGQGNVGGAIRGE
jgi:hypothetical protein